MRITYTEVKLSDVLDYYTEDFQPSGQERIVKVEKFVDLKQGIVIFKAYLNKTNQPKGEKRDVR